MKIDVRQIDGYAYGAIQPSTILSFHDATANDQSFLKKLETLFECMPRFEDPNRFSFESVSLDQSSIPVIFVNILDALNHFCGDQRFTPIHVFQEDTSLSFAVPTLSNPMTRFNMGAMKALVDVAARDNASAKVQDFLETHKSKTRPFLPSGTNAGNFIAAAAERKIPFKIFSPKYVIFGYGSGSRIFNSSITDGESAIGVGLAKSKVDTNRLLKMSGIPVAEQARVRTLEDALSFADKIGYPVVLKPESEEQSRGVYANIVDEAELRDCWALLTERSYKAILLEKHVLGDVYRINTIDHKVVRVVRRNPPSVRGDGSSTIGELLAKLNSEPIRTNPNSSVSKINIDEDVLRTLSKQDFELETVLEKDHLALLSSTCRNDYVTDFLDKFHPENRVLCEKISRIMRLEVTGIDVLAIDPSRTWRNGNFVICEVNSQPQLGVSHMHLYDDFLAQKFKEKPFIRLVISSVSAGEISLFDPVCTSMEITISPAVVVRQGCPVQYFDELEISDDVSDEERKKIERMLVSVQPDIGPAIS